MSSGSDLPPLDESMKGDTSLFSWMVTINSPSMFERLGSTTELLAENEVPRDRREFSSTVTHEAIHFIQALTTSYIYRTAYLLWCEVQNVVQQIRRLPDSIIKLPLQVKSSMGTLLDQMHAKVKNLATPDISGISALDIIEGSAVYIDYRVHLPKLDNREYLRRIETEYKNLRVYSDAYRLAEWYLGDDVFDIFSVICFLALCSQEPGNTFCRYVRALGRSGILRNHKHLTVQEVIDLGSTVGITELRSAPEEANISGQHPILFPYLKDLTENPPQGFEFKDFAARPYEYEDVEIFRRIRPPLVVFRGGLGNSMLPLPDLIADVPFLSEPSDKDKLNFIVTLTAICGAVRAMIWPGEYHLQCPHTNCPYHRLRLCHSYVSIPPSYQECGFIERFESVFQRPLSTIQFEKDSE